MINQNLVLLLAHKRKDAGKSLMHFARQTGTPQSTVYDRARASAKYVRKHTAILDFKKLGLAHFYFLIKPQICDRQRLQEFLHLEQCVNSVFRITCYDFLAEAVFRDIGDAENFWEKLQADFKIDTLYKYNVIEVVKQEDFLVGGRDERIL
jgi:DNA-binding Lrp family transcriptional regulator